jgi:hypothetical protein
MCLYVGNKNGFVTKEDITVYKVLKKGADGYKTPYQGYPVTLGKDLIPSGDPNFDEHGYKFSLNGGAIHAYLNPVEARRNDNGGEIFKATIPAGTRMWIQDDLNQVAARKLHITKDTVSRATEQLYTKTLESLVPQFALDVLLMDKSIVSVQEGCERKGVIGIKVGKHIVSTEWFQDVAFCTSQTINSPKSMDFDEASKDFNGEENQRDILLKNPDLEFPALEKARKLGGYVPAIGELKEVFLSLAEINITRFALGLENIPWGYWFYSSSMRSDSTVWNLSSGGDWGNWDYYVCLGCRGRVLPFFSSCE